MLPQENLISKKKKVYTDHFSLNLIFKNVPLKSNLAKRGQKFTTCNTNRVGGWEVFKMLTENNNKLKSIPSNAADTSIMMKKIDNELEKAKINERNDKCEWDSEMWVKWGLIREKTKSGR